MGDPHTCIANQKCRNGKTVDGIRHPAITEGQHQLCDPCRSAFHNAINRLPQDWRNLRNALGERHGGSSDKVKSSRTPAIPINVGAETIMFDILETTDRTATIIAGLIDAEPPTAKRKPAKILDPNTGRPIEPPPGSLADHTHHTLVEAPHIDRINANTRLIEASIDLLATSGDHDLAIWDDEGEDLGQPLARTTDGEPLTARGRRFVTHTGLDLLNQLKDLHQRTRAHLGHTKLRHHYHLPCPAYDKHGNYCGAMTVGRDDGNDWVNCTTCHVQWTEREFDWLKTMIAGDKEIDMLRWLLAEAYWRLDDIQHVTDLLSDDERMKLAEAGPIILDRLHQILNAAGGHPRPEQRNTAA